MTCEFFPDSLQGWLFIKFMPFLSSKEKKNGWGRCWGEEGINLGEQISQFSYLTFLKWFCNSEQERIINRNGCLFFGAFTVLFPYNPGGTWSKRSKNRTRRKPNLELVVKKKPLSLSYLP